MSKVYPTSSSRPSTGADRVKAMIIASADKAPASVRPYIHHIATAVSLAVVVWDKIEPVISFLITTAIWAYKKLPEELIPGVFGLLLCFFGGTFAALIAAFEAFRLTGWTQTCDSCNALYTEYLRIKEINENDEKADLDEDGVPDVQQKTPSELVLHKANLFVTSVKNPEMISNAITGIFGSCLSVVAVLRVEFARTITLGVAIGNAMRGVAEK